MKNYLSLLIGVLIVVLFITTSAAFHFWQVEKNERERLSVNLDQYGRAISTLVLTNTELDSELQKQNEVVMAADSILRAKNRRISQLESLVATKVTIRDTDTVYIPLKPDPVPVEQVDTLPALYRSTFTNTKSCITVSGFILSTDPDPSLAITERSTDIKVYDIRIKRKWYQFWRPREERLIESNCGKVEILTINKKQ